MFAMKRAGVVFAAVAAALLLSCTAAYAVSDGQYRSARQHCTGDADNSEKPQRTEPGCQALTINVQDGNGEPLFFGFQQTPDGTSVDPTSPVYGLRTNQVNTLNSWHLYFGADDNLDSGEHDSSPEISNGPSDGGAIAANYDLATLRPWVNALMNADAAYLATHPVPLLDAGFGSCADGFCLAITTQERVAYTGGGDPSHRQPVADYSGKQWDPPDCAGPSDSAKECGPGGIKSWHKRDGVRTTEPGVQVFEDPDPQGSPIGPYPIPALYVGTCGVIAGGGGDQGGPAPAAPDSPITNSAGQLYVPTAC